MASDSVDLGFAGAIADLAAALAKDDATPNYLRGVMDHVKLNLEDYKVVAEMQISVRDSELGLRRRENELLDGNIDRWVWTLARVLLTTLVSLGQADHEAEYANAFEDQDHKLLLPSDVEQMHAALRELEAKECDRDAVLRALQPYMAKDVADGAVGDGDAGEPSLTLLARVRRVEVNVYGAEQAAAPGLLARVCNVEAAMFPPDDRLPAATAIFVRLVAIENALGL